MLSLTSAPEAQSGGAAFYLKAALAGWSIKLPETELPRLSWTPA